MAEPFIKGSSSLSDGAYREQQELAQRREDNSSNTEKEREERKTVGNKMPKRKVEEVSAGSTMAPLDYVDEKF